MKIIALQIIFKIATMSALGLVNENEIFVMHLTFSHVRSLYAYLENYLLGSNFYLNLITVLTSSPKLVEILLP